MAIEVAAARVLAPTLGVSLYSWTAVIGVVLAGLAAGGWVGGWLADRVGAGRVLLGGAAVAAYGALALPLASELAPAIQLGSWEDVVARTVCVAVATLLVPSLGLGAIVPAAVRATGASGRSVGAIYAATTAGSILGVFATGLLLIDAIGSRATIVAAGAAVLLVAALGGGRGQLAGLLLLAPFGLALGAPAWLRGPCTTESAYFCIQVLETGDPGAPRTLRLDRLVHGAISPDDPTAIGRGYARLMADLTEAFAPPVGPRALFVGGGAYVVPRYVAARWPSADVDVVEIDPRVTEVAVERLGLVPSPRLRTHALDARQFLIARPSGRGYDLVYGDAFNDLSIPHHLTTREFAAMVREALAPDGIYLVNVIDLLHEGRLLRSFVATLRAEFPSVDVVLDIGELEGIRAERSRRSPGSPEPRRAAIVVAARQRPDFARLDALPRGTGVALPREELGAYLAGGRGVVLTDDHAPVDALTAPLFLGRPI